MINQHSAEKPHWFYTARIALVLVAIMVAPGLFAASWEYMNETTLSWRTYGKKTYDEAKKLDRPLFVFIYADWCKWCKKFEKETLETPKIRKLLQDKYIPVTVNYDKQPKLAKQLGAKLVPTVVLIAPNNEKLLRFYGFLEKEDLADTLEQTMMAWRKGELPDKEVREFGEAETCCPLVKPKEN